MPIRTPADEWTIQERILRALLYGPLNVTDIEDMTGDLHQSVSPQLAKLNHERKIFKLKKKKVNKYGSMCHLWRLRKPGELPNEETC